MDLSDPASFTPEDSPLTLADLMTRPEYLELMAPVVVEGDQAPDFELPRLGGGGTVRLADVAKNQPVVLVFGSYT